MSAFILVTIESVLSVLLGPVHSLTSVSTSKKISDQSLKKPILLLLDRELHTRRFVSPVMMLIHTCAEGVRGACSPENFLIKMVRSGAF